MKDKVLWPEEPNPVLYKSLKDLKQAIGEGTAPKNIPRSNFLIWNFGWARKSGGICPDTKSTNQNLSG